MSHSGPKSPCQAVRFDSSSARQVPASEADASGTSMECRPSGRLLCDVREGQDLGCSAQRAESGMCGGNCLVLPYCGDVWKDLRRNGVARQSGRDARVTGRLSAVLPSQMTPPPREWQRPGATVHRQFLLSGHLPTASRSGSTQSAVRSPISDPSFGNSVPSAGGEVSSAARSRAGPDVCLLLVVGPTLSRWPSSRALEVCGVAPATCPELQPPCAASSSRSVVAQNP
jgi:hypothetical protein